MNKVDCEWVRLKAVYVCIRKHIDTFYLDEITCSFHNVAKLPIVMKTHLLKWALKRSVAYKVYKCTSYNHQLKYKDLVKDIFMFKYDNVAMFFKKTKDCRQNCTFNYF